MEKSVKLKSKYKFIFNNFKKLFAPTPLKKQKSRSVTENILYCF